MARLRLLVLLLAVAATGPACSSTPPNPFVNESTSFVPPADADLVFTGNGWAAQPGEGRELFSVRIDGTDLQQLTFCNSASMTCDTVEAALAPDHGRAALRRRTDPAPDEALLFADLSRSVTAELVPSDRQVSGIDWAPNDDLLVYSALGARGLEDLFRTDPVRPTPDNQENTLDLTCPPPLTPTLPVMCNNAFSDRRPRLDPTGSEAALERFTASGKSLIWTFVSAASQTQVTTGGAGSGTLEGTPYAVGSDADPSYSPDGGSLVFRRLTGPGSPGLGIWDILTVAVDGSGLRSVVTGARFRGSPAWGPQGIVFPEIDPATGEPSLIVVQPDGSGRRTVLTLGAGYMLSYPRWLR
jgi:hypothetical protein